MTWLGLYIIGAWGFLLNKALLLKLKVKRQSVIRDISMNGIPFLEILFYSQR